MVPHQVLAEDSQLSTAFRTRTVGYVQEAQRAVRTMRLEHGKHLGLRHILGVTGTCICNTRGTNEMMKRGEGSERTSSKE